jgi:hypothetical protein
MDFKHLMLNNELVPENAEELPAFHHTTGYEEFKQEGRPI